MSADAALFTAFRRGRHLSPRERAICEAALAVGPWLALPPPDDDATPPASAKAPPALPPGRTLLVAADDDGDGGSAMAFTVTASLHDAWPTRLEAVALGPAAQRAYVLARHVAAEALPLRWRGGAPDAPAAPAVRVLRWRRGGAPKTSAASEADGPSFGLAFGLALAAAAHGSGLRVDVCALAALADDGSPQPVGGLDAKFSVVAQLPGIRRLLVAPAQREEAAVLCARHWPLGEAPRLCAPATLAEAVDLALAAPPEVAIQALADDAPARDAFVAALCRLCLEGHDGVRHWPPVVRAAATATLAFGAALPADARFQLELAAAIASRHAKAALPLPDLTPLERWPLARRLLALAHAVQHAADVGAPAIEVLAPSVQRLLPRDNDGFEAHARLAGAWGRLLAACAKPEEALYWQRRAVDLRLAAFAERGLSHPLCELLRLGGLLRRPTAVAHARAVRDQAQALGALRQADLPYLALADALADAGLGAATAADDLGRLVRDPTAPRHVRLSAARHALRLHAPGVSATAAERLLRGEDLPSETAGHVRLFAAIAALDGIAAGCDDGSEAARHLAAHLAAARQELPGTLAHLQAAAEREGLADPSAALAAFVATHFPY